ncbi:histidine kinase [Mucilaginibacter sp. UR6-1]|uniref:sensor histidine kinase n=1 Tax=Mucilaginibacter sp. UR6-1 TaxID=1435643 RepID=UPI001E598DDA|nr:histidine kinase [Mucilaginibacter sp. UR6-1]MCC8408118.1 histidine kinase [Mucilaginibacter sp. UR6-1]
MPARLPVKNLVRANGLLISVFSTVVFLFLIFLMEESEIHKFFYAVLTAVAISLISFANVAIMNRLVRIHGFSTPKFKVYRYVFTYCFSALTYWALSPVFDYVSPKDYSQSNIYLFILLIASVVVNTIIILLHDYVILQSNKAQADLEYSKIKAKHAEAVTLLLKQQIHPHFLFNALNTLKALYRSDLDKGDSYLVHLAGFLRASVYSHSAKTATLAEELTILNDYLEMQRIRFGVALNCRIQIEDVDADSSYLPSFSLQPLLENAIKHNELTTEHPLHISVSITNGRVVVTNTLRKKLVQYSTTNSGLANLAERYRLLSGDEVIIVDNNTHFTVSIKLLNDEYHNY